MIADTGTVYVSSVWLSSFAMICPLVTVTRSGRPFSVSAEGAGGPSGNVVVVATAVVMGGIVELGEGATGVVVVEAVSTRTVVVEVSGRATDSSGGEPSVEVWAIPLPHAVMTFAATVTTTSWTRERGPSRPSGIRPDCPIWSGSASSS